MQRSEQLVGVLVTGVASVRVKGLRRWVAASRFGALAALPLRIALGARHIGTQTACVFRYLVHSHEHTNFTYELTELNTAHLAWWVSNETVVTLGEAKRLLEEATRDEALRDHVRDATRTSSRRSLADEDLLLHRRLGWYAIVRATRPERVVETGTDKSLGSVLIASALLRNGIGRLTTIDLNPASGYLIGGEYAKVIDVVLDDSLRAIESLSPGVDLFIHDSLHTRSHELAEYQAIEPKLTDRAVVLSDNAHATDSLPAWAELTGRRFSYWQERPLNHWYAGAGIGLATTAPSGCLLHDGSTERARWTAATPNQVPDE